MIAAGSDCGEAFLKLLHKKIKVISNPFGQNKRAQGTFLRDSQTGARPIGIHHLMMSLNEADRSVIKSPPSE